ncbi:hypothetical protein DIJ64_08075 [Mycobacterium leprae]|uniref:Uncharacterized protein n=1 Tax=Mycobacterium leprae TaxID=1769 RepID=A0AAD0KSS1_MYCLR|nr:hypothetical protein DIJ64_08075 [Mycobacterium leprae]
MNCAVDVVSIGTEFGCDFRRGNLGIEIIKTGRQRVHLYRRYLEAKSITTLARSDLQRSPFSNA